MDTVMPLTLNLNKNSAGIRNADKFESHSSDSQSSSKKAPQVLGRDQAKKRLQAFAQQWNKTKDNLNMDKALQVQADSHGGGLKYTYVVAREDGSEISFPIELIKYTSTQPSVSYCPNPHYLQGAFKSRTQVLNEADDDERRVIHTIMNSNAPSCSENGFIGRYRKWFMDRNTFLGKALEEEPGRFSPQQWESDSEEAFSNYQQPFELDFMPQLPIKATGASRVISKVKINKVELPFFEDDDFLDNLVSKGGIKEEHTSTIDDKYHRDDDEDDWSRNGSRERHRPSSSSRDWSYEDDRDAFFNGDPRKRHREPSTPDWDEQWRSSSRYSSRRKDRHRRRSPRPPSPPEEEFNEAGPSNGFILDEMEATADGADSKRISLDERLELELGIKVEGEINERPLSTDQLSVGSPVKRRPGFGPKAAPLGPFILNCRKALPAAPIIPLHLQKALCRPLSQAVKTKPLSEQVDMDGTKDGEKSAVGDNGEKTDGSDQETKKKTLTKELNTLEIIANTLEMADDSVWLDLEEKLLRFEKNMHSGTESPPPEGDELEPPPKKKASLSKRAKRPKPPPIEFKEVGKGILVMPRITLIENPGENRKKGVMFADNVKPGFGTSSEEEDEVLLPIPPPPVVETKKSKKTKRIKRPKIEGEDFDIVFDMMPPPPAPPGSPPPHLDPTLTQRTLVSSPPMPSLVVSTASGIAVLINSPAVESGAC